MNTKKSCPLDDMFLDKHGIWHMVEQDPKLPQSTWNDSLYTWDYPTNEGNNNESAQSTIHVCMEFVDVGFHFTKMVCRECGKDKVE